MCPFVTKFLCRNWLVLSCAVKLPPKPTATGETWQSCRLGKEGVAATVMITVAVGIQTDTAELVCTVTVRRFVLARGNKGIKRRKVLPLTQAEHAWVKEKASFLHIHCMNDANT